MVRVGNNRVDLWFIEVNQKMISSANPSLNTFRPVFFLKVLISQLINSIITSFLWETFEAPAYFKFLQIILWHKILK